MNNKGADQTAWMRRLICAFVVRIWHKTHFLMAWLNFYSQYRDLLMSRLMTKPTKWPAWPAKTQISLGICQVWSESVLSAWRNLGSLAIHWMHSEYSVQTGRMPRLIWVFAGHTVILLVLSWRGSFNDVIVVHWSGAGLTRSVGSDWYSGGRRFDPRVRTIFRRDLVMKWFLWPFSSYFWFK